MHDEGGCPWQARAEESLNALLSHVAIMVAGVEGVEHLCSTRTECARCSSVGKRVVDSARDRKSLVAHDCLKAPVCHELGRSNHSHERLDLRLQRTREGCTDRVPQCVVALGHLARLLYLTPTARS